LDLSVALATLAVIVPVELPDKTFVATLVLATRYRPLPVWIGVALAFAVQTAVAVTAGGLLTRLPHRPVTAVAAGLFAVGAVLLWRGAGQAEARERQSEAEFGARLRRDSVSGWRVVGTSFAVLFLAEWGDLSQLLTAGLVVRYRDPVSVFAGAWLALLAVSGAAALLGRTLLTRIRLAIVRRVGATLCVALAVAAGLAAAGVDVPV
jgi:putative Ca2+/H+ antiporter (TMEM165/GDT1 family)